MGRFSMPLAPLFGDFAGIDGQARVVDVGCGPGALTAELVARLGADRVSAVDPSESFVSAARERHPGVDVRESSAELLPFDDGSFDAALAQLVVHFMSDPEGGLREMARVTRPGGVVAACVWDQEQGASSLLWQAAAAIGLENPGEAPAPGTPQGDLARRFREAGMSPDLDASLTITRSFGSFEEWWEPFTLGVGGAGRYVARLDADSRRRLMEESRTLVPEGPFELSPRVWAVRARVT